MNVSPDVLAESRRIIVGVFKCVLTIGLILAIAAGLLAGVAYVVTVYTFYACPVSGGRGSPTPRSPDPQ